MWAKWECVCSYVKDGSGKAQDEMGPAQGCSAVSKVIDQGHQKIIMRTNRAPWWDQTLFTRQVQQLDRRCPVGFSGYSHTARSHCTHTCTQDSIKKCSLLLRPSPACGPGCRGGLQTAQPLGGRWAGETPRALSAWSPALCDQGDSALAFLLKFQNNTVKQAVKSLAKYGLVYKQEVKCTTEWV